MKYEVYAGNLKYSSDSLQEVRTVYLELVQQQYTSFVYDKEHNRIVVANGDAYDLLNQLRELEQRNYFRSCTQ